MRVQQQPDGNWVTAPTYCGFDLKEPCPEDSHQWEAKGSPVELADDVDLPGVTYMTMQVCKKCSWQRFLLHKEK